MLAWMVFALAGTPRALEVEVPVYVAAKVAPATLARGLDEAARLFEPAGIVLSFDLSPGPVSGEPVARIIIQPRPARFRVHGCSRGLHDHRLGHTHFPSRRITIWSQQIARAVAGTWDRKDVPGVDETVYARAFGRVLAHELGHLLLRLDGHRETGLMRAAFSHASLTSRGGRAFRFSHQDLAAIRGALERPLARRAGATP